MEPRQKKEERKTKASASGAIHCKMKEHESICTKLQNIERWSHRDGPWWSLMNWSKWIAAWCYQAPLTVNCWRKTVLLPECCFLGVLWDMRGHSPPSRTFSQCTLGCLTEMQREFHVLCEWCQNIASQTREQLRTGVQISYEGERRLLAAVQRMGTSRSLDGGQNTAMPVPPSPSLGPLSMERLICL